MQRDVDYDSVIPAAPGPGGEATRLCLAPNSYASSRVWTCVARHPLTVFSIVVLASLVRVG